MRSSYDVQFFFSSRRRHTRSKRDWSSDVCSSDLVSTGITTALYEIPVDTAPKVQHIWAAFGRTSIELDAIEREACSGLSQLGMATTLAPVDSREVLRCDRCQLVQFRTNNNLCRRCRTSLDPEEPQIVAPPPLPTPAPSPRHPHLQVAFAIRMLRHRGGMSQRQLAARMNVPRTYVSKIENEKATPTLSSLERLARALEVTVPELLSGGERTRQEEISELVKDQFIAELLPFVSQLNGMQMSSILTQVRDLTVRPRRSA